MAIFEQNYKNLSMILNQIPILFKITLKNQLFFKDY